MSEEWEGNSKCPHPATWTDRVHCAEPCGESHIRCTRCQTPIYGCILWGNK